MARIDVIEVTGITSRGEEEREADIRVRVVPTDVGQHLIDGVAVRESDEVNKIDFSKLTEVDGGFTNGEEGTMSVSFRRYDDGWRIEQHTLKGLNPLTR